MIREKKSTKYIQFEKKKNFQEAIEYCNWRPLEITNNKKKFIIFFNNYLNLIIEFKSELGNLINTHTPCLY